jgi:hypothetical protein
MWRGAVRRVGGSGCRGMGRLRGGLGARVERGRRGVLGESGRGGW